MTQAIKRAPAVKNAGENLIWPTTITGMEKPPIRQLQSTVEKWARVLIHHSCSAGNNALYSVELAGGPL
jgi:2-methylisocitrate lyase-like PEP mutase family enzyme